jgi:hypothetical protein
MNTKIETLEKKVIVMRRVPPGDRWNISPDTATIYNSLTDALEEYFQRTGQTEYFMSAREGTVSVITTEEVKIEQPIQRYSLYGEN